MKPHADVQLIHHEGEPAFAVIPYARYLELIATGEGAARIPGEVVRLQIEQGLSLLAAWRIYKGVSQPELAEAMGITQSAVAQMESPQNKPRLKTLRNAAAALRIPIECLTSERG